MHLRTAIRSSSGFYSVHVYLGAGPRDQQQNLFYSINYFISSADFYESNILYESSLLESNNRASESVVFINEDGAESGLCSNMLDL